MRQRMSEAQRQRPRRPHSPETRQKIFQGNRGQTRSQAVRDASSRRQRQPEVRARAQQRERRKCKIKAGLDPTTPDWTERDCGFVTPCHVWWNPRKAPYVKIWVEVFGPIHSRDGYILHHMCENRACVRLSHLIPVTYAQHEEIHQSQKKGTPEGRQRSIKAGRAARTHPWRCDECGLVTNPGTLGRHQKYSGHTGRTKL